MSSHPTRRHFIKYAVTSAIIAPIAANLWPTLACAQDLPHVDEADPTAKALQYVADAGKVDKTKSPQFKAGTDCSNCRFYQGKAGEAWGPCQLFPGKAVAAKGWCVSYVAKA